MRALATRIAFFAPTQLATLSQLPPGLEAAPVFITRSSS
jgi:hypothetical protein